jgi:rubrerythrin
MATVEGKHASQIMAEMGWHEAPVSAWGLAWQGSEAAETIHHDELHYLMQPWHALKLALAAEQRAESFFAHLAASAVAEPVRAAARELLEEEREHVALIQAWLSKVPEPDHNWEDDPDPPRIDD